MADGNRFGAQRRRVRRVLDVGSRIDLAALSHGDSTDPQSRVRGIRPRRNLGGLIE